MKSFESFKFAVPAVVLGALIGIAGCAHYAPLVSSNAPAWVNKGSGAFKDSQGQGVFYGVSGFKGSQNPILARQAAGDRACAQIAQTMNRYVAILDKDYMSATTAGNQSKTADEQFVSQTQKTFTQFTLTGAHVVDYWKSSGGTIYALCKMDLNGFLKNLDQANQLSSQVRDFVRKDAQKAFSDLSKNEKAHSSGAISGGL